MPDVIERIRLLVLDVDGVLTDGRLHIDDHGVEHKSFHVRDGLAIRLWQRLGGEVAIITGRSGTAVRHRAGELGIRHVHQGVRDKREAFRRLLLALDVDASEAAVLGDDLPDLPMLRLAGYPMAVADAVGEVRGVASYVTVSTGGHAAVREAVEHLLHGADRWDEALAFFE